MANMIKYKGQVYQRVDSAFDEGKSNLRRLHDDVLTKVYFGDIIIYLKDMAEDKERSGEHIQAYKEALTAFKNFVPSYQKLMNSLRKLPNFS